MHIGSAFASVAQLAAEQKRLQDLQDALDPLPARELRKQQEALGYDPHLADLNRQIQRVEDAVRLDRQVAAVPEQERQGDHALGGMARYLSPEREALDKLAGGHVRPPGSIYSPLSAQAAGLLGPLLARREADVRTVADIGRRVRQARKEMKMTQQRFADLAGVGRRFLIELEQGKPSLEIGRVLAVCQAAGLKLRIVGTPDAHP